MLKDEKTKMILFVFSIFCLGIVLIYTSNFNGTNNKNVQEKVKSNVKQINTTLSNESIQKEKERSTTNYQNLANLIPPSSTDILKEESGDKIILSKNDGDIYVISVYSGNYKGGNSPNHEAGDVNVKVNTKTPIVLFLNAYEPVRWHINLSNGAKINTIITAGCYNQEVLSLNKNFDHLIINHYYELNTATNYDYQKAEETIQRITGEKPVFVQAKHTGTNFIIDNQN